MELSLPAKFRKLIDDRVRSGKYATPEDVVKTALTTLDQNDRFGEFAPGELDRLIEEGEQSLKRDGPIPADPNHSWVAKLPASFLTGIAINSA